MEEQLDALLNTAATDDGRDPEFDMLWQSMLEPPPDPPITLEQRRPPSKTSPKTPLVTTDHGATTSKATSNGPNLPTTTTAASTTDATGTTAATDTTTGPTATAPVKAKAPSKGGFR